LNRFPDFLLGCRHEGSEIIVTWRPLKSVTWRQSSSTDIVQLQLAIRSELTGAILCSVSVDPMATNTHTFFVDEIVPTSSTSFVLTASFIDGNNYCERIIPTYKIPPNLTSTSILVSCEWCVVCDTDQFFSKKLCNSCTCFPVLLSSKGTGNMCASRGYYCYSIGKHFIHLLQTSYEISLESK
uniref:Uncharacterized protein n=1 Tax=Anopheles coluzzii TaxID=1518534 RepID=A0A8W7NY19_ANOCL